MEVNIAEMRKYETVKHYLHHVALTSDDLSAEDVKNLYEGGYYNIFLNYKITIPTKILRSYMRMYLEGEVDLYTFEIDSFLRRKDVQADSNEIYNIYISGFVSAYTRANGGSRDKAVRVLKQNLENFHNEGVLSALSPENERVLAAQLED